MAKKLDHVAKVFYGRVKQLLSLVSVHRVTLTL